MTNHHSITRLAELLAQPERPAIDVIALALKSYLSDLAATYGKPSLTWHDPVPERLALLVAKDMASKDRASVIDVLFEMCATENLPIGIVEPGLGDDLREAANDVARAWEREAEGAA